MSKLPKNTPSVEQEEILYTLYYKDNFTFGRDRLYKYIQEHFPNSKISRRMVYNWLSRQELHQRFQQVRHTKNIQHTVLEEPKKQIGIDLVNMEHYEYKGHKYILTGIDLFSKKAYARPLKDKEAKTVTKAMEDLIKNEIHYVSSIRSDNGSEFIADEFKKLLDKYEIKQVFSLAGKPQSNGQIENFNKTLKRALIMGMKINKNNDWISILHKVINNFNESIHSVTKHKPNDLDIEDDDDILDDVKDEISDSVTSRNESDKVKFKIGDKVRIKLDEDEKGKGGENWSKKIFTVYRVMKSKNNISSPSYYVEDKDNKYTKKYYNNDLLYIPAVENASDEPERFEIAKLIKPINTQQGTCIYCSLEILFK